MEDIDSKYGFPIAMGEDYDGFHAEQIQFIDGVHLGWKITRFSVHTFLDGLTYGLWEFLGTSDELLNREYPIYVYYIVYDEHNRVVKKVYANSEEGIAYSKLNWSAPFVPDLKVNKDGDLRFKYLCQEQK